MSNLVVLIAHKSPLALLKLIFQRKKWFLSQNDNKGLVSYAGRQNYFSLDKIMLSMQQDRK